MTTTETTANVTDMSHQNFGQQVMEATQAVKLDRRWLPARRAMSKENIRKVAELFETNEKSVSGGKKFLDSKHPFVAPVYRCIRDATALVARFSFDYPERGIRLMRADRINELVGKFQALQEELAEAVNDMANHWDEIVADRRADLGPKGLFTEADYNIDVRKAFGLYLSFPTVKPDDRIAQMHPELYEAQQQRVYAAMERAVVAAEAEATEKLSEMLAFLIDKLQPGEDGKPKTMHKTAVTNIRECVEWFNSATLRSNDELNALVEQIDSMVAGTDSTSLKKTSPAGRQRFAQKLEELKTSVDSLVVDRPGRRFKLS